MSMLELDGAAFDALTPARRAEFLRLMALAYPPRSRWYCDRARCDGEPHPGWHWCEHPLPHPLGGEQYQTCRHARWQQRPPDGDWRTWLFLGGRGAGKTRSGAEWILDQAQSHPGTGWVVIARTGPDLQKACFEGPSGILKAAKVSRNDRAYNISQKTLRLPNESVIYGLSADEPGAMRGPDLHGGWFDEIVTWKHRAAYDDIVPGIRHGAARIVITTTPQPKPLLLELVKAPGVVVTRSSLFDNERNLSAQAVVDFKTMWAGTRRARQELYGELLEDVPGALWTQQMLDETRGRSLLDEAKARRAS